MALTDGEPYQLLLRSVKKNGLDLMLAGTLEIAVDKALAHAAVEQNPKAIQYVPKELITPELLKVAIEAEKHAPEILVRRNDNDHKLVVLSSLQKQLADLEQSEGPEHNETYRLLLRSVRKDGLNIMLAGTLEVTMDKALTHAAVEQNPKAIRYVPKELITSELLKVAIEAEKHAPETLVRRNDNDHKRVFLSSLQKHLADRAQSEPPKTHQACSENFKGPTNKTENSMAAPLQEPFQNDEKALKETKKSTTAQHHTFVFKALVSCSAISATVAAIGMLMLAGMATVPVGLAAAITIGGLASSGFFARQAVHCSKASMATSQQQEPIMTKSCCA